MKIFTGEKARKIVKEKIQEEKFSSDLNEIRGHTAYPGIAIGAVKFVFTADDIKKVKSGDILVSNSNCVSPKI